VTKHYVRFALMMLTSLVLMFVLSMSMIRTWDHFYVNLSNFWMALVMVSAMGLVMVGFMWGMLPSRRVNVALLVGFVVLLLGSFALGRTETAVGNEQFLKSMIPHHSRAVLVCQEANITDSQIQQLCDEIVKAQLREIAEMKQMLARDYGGRW
jgi:uncharacterized protein (DUF305 family)